jgi:uncharacterized protein (DUF433 family)
MAQFEIDWTDCPLVEVDPQRVGGRPVLKGTRMPADDLVANYESGVSVDEIAEQFRIPLAPVQDLLRYAETHHTLARPLR